MAYTPVMRVNALCSHVHDARVGSYLLVVEQWHCRASAAVWVSIQHPHVPRMPDTQTHVLIMLQASTLLVSALRAHLREQFCIAAAGSAQPGL